MIWTEEYWRIFLQMVNLLFPSFLLCLHFFLTACFAVTLVAIPSSLSFLSLFGPRYLLKAGVWWHGSRRGCSGWTMSFFGRFVHDSHVSGRRFWSSFTSSRVLNLQLCNGLLLLQGEKSWWDQKDLRIGFRRHWHSKSRWGMDQDRKNASHHRVWQQWTLRHRGDPGWDEWDDTDFTRRDHSFFEEADGSLEIHPWPQAVEGYPKSASGHPIPWKLRSNHLCTVGPGQEFPNNGGPQLPVDAEVGWKAATFRGKAGPESHLHGHNGKVLCIDAGGPRVCCKQGGGYIELELHVGVYHLVN